MKNFTIALTYFRSLALVNLEAALHSIARQNLSRVNSIVVIDNNTEDNWRDIEAVINRASSPLVPTCFSSFKHGDPTKTHAWSTNTAVRRTQTSWVMFTRADYLLEPSLMDRFTEIADSKPEDWHGMITSFGMHLHADIGVVNQTGWRNLPSFPPMGGDLIDYTPIDSGVWMMPRTSFEKVNGLEERLTAWGHAQTHFQYKLHTSGCEFVCVPKVLFYHPLHSGERDLDEGNRQLADIGVDLKEMWARSQVKVY